MSSEIKNSFSIKKIKNKTKNMKAIFIEETKGTPRVEFNPTGEMLVSGRSLPEDPISFYNPLLEWANNCTAEKVTLDLRLEYMNTSSSKQIYSLLTNIAENVSIKSVTVNWYYEEGDDDGYETGKEFESMIKLPFNFHEYAEVLG